jgi:RimJ/RimL family protein N-acetyltransferase
MSLLTLVAILEDGMPAYCSGEMSPSAREACEGTAAMYEQDGYAPPWIGYLAELGGEFVGSCAFKSAPRQGQAEIAYWTFAEFEGQGIGSAMVRELILLARRTDPKVIVTAQTLPAESPSTAILRKLGFVELGTAEHPEDGLVWQWARVPRP